MIPRKSDRHDFPFRHGEPSKRIRGRLAPSPTGAQHLGNARTFLIAWLSARMLGGQLLLRMEDLDTPRTKPGAAEQAVEDLRWLGLDWDWGPENQTDDLPRLIQTHRLPRYLELLEELKSQDRVYPCTCTRSDVEGAASAPHESSNSAIQSIGIGTETRYRGTCAERSAPDGETLRRQGKVFAWRFRMPDRRVAWTDGFSGPQACNPSIDLGDFVIGRANGAPAYQLAVVADDHDMEITEVVRGDDLIPSTYRQLALYEAFGWSAPEWVHVPLVVGVDGRRLAKRHGDTRLASLRQDGVRPESILGFFAWKHAWIDTPTTISAKELLQIADLRTIPREPLLAPESLVSK